MSRKKDKKRRSISSAQNQRHQEKLSVSNLEQPEPPEGLPPAIAVVPSGGSPSDTVAFKFSDPVDTITVPVMLTIDQLGQWLNLSRSTIHRLDKAGNLPGRVLIGRQVRYHRPAIESWILKGLTQ